MTRAWFARHIWVRRAVPIRIIIFVGVIMLPTMFLGYLAIRTEETERLVVWEKLKESYTSLANVVSDQLDNMLSYAENDFRDSISALSTHDKDSLQQLSYQLSGKHRIMGPVFFLNASGKMVFPEDPQTRQRDDVGAEYAVPDQEEKDIFESYIAAGERQEFKHSNPQRAIYEYQRISDEVREPVYKAIALNGIARCYAKLGLNQDAVSYYNEIIDKYMDVSDGWVDIAAIAYLQAASAYKKMGDVDAAVRTLMDLYSNLSPRTRGWDLDAEEIAYFADRAQRQLMIYRDSGDTRFSPFADGFAEIDTDVVRLVKLQRFLKNYERLISDEMAQILNRAATDSGFVLHLLRYTDAGPYLVSYITNPAGASLKPAPAENNIALAGFEVDLSYLASQGFNEALSGLTIKDDVALAILTEDGAIVGATHEPPVQGAEHSKNPPEFPFPKGGLALGKPITTVTSSSLPFWKVGVYLKEPQSLEKLSKRKASLRIYVIIGLVLAIAFGIYLVLREAKREAELVRLRSDFVANVSHELRTPLSSIQIFSETLKQDRLPSREKREQYLNTISSESSRLARLVDNVLDFSRLERRTKEFDLQPIDIGVVVRSAAEAYRFYAEQRGATIRLNIAQHLPEIEADSEAISQMVINLVDNAVKYSEDESEIAINVFRRGNRIVIQVADKGVGIDEEDMKKIFDKFYRGKNVAYLGTGGTGLGLTLVKAVAEAHGGDIRVRSKRGVGSRFSVILPLSVTGDTHSR